eukprot:TRINITY_DN419_c0_g1_i2.p1 TRINITY_DN419_c0_g1~~TRINITY_DN419_c0_g1_i2.p1  ORF type:complete len:279 (-),score=19.98 TRINITY_DN419_c0_g1_i2:708-1544(-)
MSGDPPKKPSVELFTFGETLGVGAFGKVVLATHKETGEQFAAKVLSKQRIVKENKLKYVTTERNILSAMSHPGIIKLKYTFQDPSRLYLILELAPGGMLLEYLNGQPLPAATATHVAAEIVSALGHMHDRGYIHRDLKPDNVLIGTDGHIRLTDFGTARAEKIVENEAENGEKRRNSFVGTDEYVAPEILDESHQHTVKCDIWSLGVLLFTIFSGRVPFKGPTQFLTFRAISENNPEFPPEMDEKNTRFYSSFAENGSKRAAFNFGDPKTRLFRRFFL